VVIETILFDLDDTLVAEIEWARTGWHLVAEHLAASTGRERAELERLMAGFFASDPHRVFDQLAGEVGLDEESVAACISLYRSSPRALTLLEDADAALEYAAARHRTGIVTDGLELTQRTKVDGAGLRSRVEVIVYTDALGPAAGKPNPSGFREALRQLQMPAPSAVYVADNAAKDFVGPRALGMRTVQVKRAGGVYEGAEAPPGGEPDVAVSSLSELPGVVAAWAAGRVS
jgi:putative hydrolase of the HAD superfamily